MIKFENIEFAYNKEKNTLKNINFHIQKGKKIAFLGENGSGKSTLFLLMNGILKTSSGEIFIEGEKLEYTRQNLIKIRKKLGIVFQDPETQIVAPTVFQEVAYGLQNLGIERELIEVLIDKALEEVGLKEHKNRLCHKLSYGEKKRVTIASILAMNPEIIVLDEPLVWLDPHNKNKVIAILKEKVKEEKTIVFSTHDVNFAYEFADYIYILKNGEIVKEGLPNEIFNDEKLIKDTNLEFPEVLNIMKFMNGKFDYNAESFLDEYRKFKEKN